MKINSKLIIATLVPTLLALIIGLAFFFSHNAMIDGQRNSGVAHTIISNTNELNQLATEYILYHEDRPWQQFLELYNLTTRLITAAQFRNPEQQRLLDIILSNTVLIKDLFLKLVSNYDQPSLNERDDLHRKVEERLAGQIIVKSRQVAADAARLERLTNEEMTATETRMDAFIFFIIVTAISLLTLVLARMRRSIATSLGNFRKGTEIVGAGDLEYRLAMPAKDEIGDLARSFDNMTERLQAVTVSKDKLHSEIEERQKTEEALRGSEQRLRFHIENSPLAIVEWDANYIVTRWSKEAERVFGWNQDEVIGKRIETLNMIYQEDIPIVERTMERLNSGKERTVVSSNRNYTKSGAVIECVWYNSVLLDAQGTMSSVLSLVLDITERKRMEEQLSRSRDELELRVQERTEELARSQQRLQHLASQLLQAQEKERKRVAVELHDSLLSELAAMKYLFEAKLMLLKKGQLLDMNEFDKVTDIMQKVMKDARGIMNNLRPSILDEMGLIPTIGWLTQEYQKTYGHIQIRRQVEA